MVDASKTAEAQAWIAAALRRRGGLCVLTGAGMSAESGIPTFRDALTGHWSRHNPMDLASEDGFRRDPALVWDWYADRRTGVRVAQPNAGHHALADAARRHAGALVLVTQNVDDLHQRAGHGDALQLHGDIMVSRWIDPCPRREAGRPACDPDGARAGSSPQCRECGNLLRPGVVWFGEALPEAVLGAAQRAAAQCAVMLVVGTSGAVWPAAGLAGRAREQGARVVILNPAASEIDAVAHRVLRGTAAGLLPLLLAESPISD
jgi:NAD-dependent deacetylase